MLGNADRKSYVSAIERGKKKLSPLTAQKFAAAFEIDEELVAQILFSAPAEDEVSTNNELLADTLLNKTDTIRRNLHIEEEPALILAGFFVEKCPEDSSSAQISLERSLKALSAIGRQLSSIEHPEILDILHFNSTGMFDNSKAILVQKAKAGTKSLSLPELEAVLNISINQALITEDIDWLCESELAKSRISSQPFQSLRRSRRKWYSHAKSSGDRVYVQISLKLCEKEMDLASNCEQTALALSDLAAAKVLCAQVTGDLHQISSAQDALELALELVTEEADPMAWATVACSFANVRLIAGESSGDVNDIRRAIAFYKQALLILEDCASNREIAIAQSSLGNALAILGRLFSDEEALDEAIKYFDKSIEHWENEGLPEEIAAGYMNMGNALSEAFDITRNANRLREARICYYTSLSHRSASSSSLGKGLTLFNLSELEEKYSSICDETSRLTKSLKHILDAIEIFEDLEIHAYVAISRKSLVRIEDSLRRVAEA